MTTHEATSALRIAHVSDIHVGASDERELASLVQDLQEASPAATVVTGDLTMRARTREFAQATEVIRAFPSPTLTVMGNHDIPLLNPLRRASSPYRRFREEVTDDLDPVLDLGSVRIQGLGSMPRWRWKSGRISERQAGLIGRSFTDAPAGTVRIVALHHPPSSGGLESIAGGGDFARALVEAEVDIVLAGHTHVPAESPLVLDTGSRRRTIIEVVAGTASRRTRGIGQSWSLLEITADTLTVTRRLAEADRWRAGTSRSFALDARAHRATRASG